MIEPVFLAPNLANEFKLAVDASDTDRSSVLIQGDSNGVSQTVGLIFLIRSAKFSQTLQTYLI